MDFKIGDNILWINSSGQEFEGIITHKFPSEEMSNKSAKKSYTCKMNEDFYNRYLKQNHVFQNNNLIYASTKEEKINKRIKTLWNTSNWVKKNPQLAY